MLSRQSAIVLLLAFACLIGCGAKVSDEADHSPTPIDTQAPALDLFVAQDSVRDAVTIDLSISLPDTVHDFLPEEVAPPGCPPGSIRCKYSNKAEQRCIEGLDGTWEWGDEVDCTEGKVCEEGSGCSCLFGACEAGGDLSACIGDGLSPCQAWSCLNGCCGVADVPPPTCCTNGESCRDCIDPESGESLYCPSATPAGTVIDLCTIDACVKGECVHTTNGSDGDPCTDDICEPTTGIWSHFPSDTQECTQILCWGLTPEEAHGKCFDNNLCTYEACSFGDQPFSPMAKPLPPIIPGQPLPPGVYLCQIVDKICIDIDPCTIDLCEPESGCLSEPNFDDPECHCDSDVDCEDNNSCTLESCDVAVEICVYSPLDCEDGNFCTIDTCYPDSGCHYEQADLPDECYDG